MAEYPKKFNEQYLITGTLGKGGMGYVYKALDRKLNREVAFKILDVGSNQGNDDPAVKRFKSEAKALKSLDHNNIVQLFDFGREGNYLYLAMTLAKGINLAELLKNRGTLEYLETIEIIKQICRALKYAHSKGIIHRDIKPSNIVVGEDNKVYLMDFGISHIQNTERLTSTGMAMGTPEYMSPEQCQGLEITNKSDIYGIGIVLYEMVCGRPPFTANRALVLSQMHTSKTPESPSKIVSDIPPKLNNIILKCLEKDPNRRYDNVEGLLNDLDLIYGNPKASTLAANIDKTPIIKRRSYLLSNKTMKILFICTILIALTILVATLAITEKMKEIPQGVQLITPSSIQGEFTNIDLEGTNGPQNYPANNLFDNLLSTAWIPPESSTKPSVYLTLPQTTIVTSIGFAIGYQKSKDDSFQDRFTMFQKPKELIIKTNTGATRKIKLQNIRGMQYFNITPFEGENFTVEIKDIYKTSDNVPTAISEMRIIGLPLIFPKK